MKFLTITPAIAVLVLSACAHQATAPVDEAPVGVNTNFYEAALTASYRTEADLERDGVRKPVETLAFMEIQPGDTVLELEAGGGYFTSLLAAVVGPEGKVYMQNPAAFDAFFDGGDPPHLATLPENVSYLRAQFDDYANVPDASVDAASWVMGPHELWYIPEGADGPLGDPTMSFREIARVLKPGASLYVQDHRAAIGSPESTGGDTHRIDQNHIDMLAASAGLVKTAESDLFANPDDDLTLNVFNPEIRGKTDQFLVRYTKE